MVRPSLRTCAAIPAEAMDANADVEQRLPLCWIGENKDNSCVVFVLALTQQTLNKCLL